MAREISEERQKNIDLVNGYVEKWKTPISRISLKMGKDLNAFSRLLSGERGIPEYTMFTLKMMDYYFDKEGKLPD
jgi:hypothetical protein